MKTSRSHSPRSQSGWALLVVMSLAAAALLLVASVMTWANENATVTARNAEYFTTAYAAESATEKVLSAMVQDDQNYGVGLVYTKTAASSYNALVPTTTDSPYWANYRFGSGSSSSGGTVIVQCVSTNVTNYAGPPYSGLQYVGSDFEIIASASNASTMYHVPATVGQEVVFGQIPIFQFAIFYNDTMEIGPGANMVINGTVHGNTNIYVDPGSGVTLSFYTDVSATGTLSQTWSPLNPAPNNPVGTINFDGNHVADVNPLTLPVGTNTSGSNTSGSVYAIIQMPPAGESPNSTIGTNRLYNQVDMIITISNNNVITVTSGVAVNGADTVISNGDWSKFINTNGSFYNMRDAATVDPIDIDIGKLTQWSNTNATLRPLLAGLRGSAAANVESIYVADNRFMSNSTITTNTSYTTNTATMTTSNYPTAGSYLPPVATNTSVTTSATYPTSNFIPPILTTNLIATTSTNSPAAGTYAGTITNNTTNYSNVSSPPSPGHYTGSITTNTTRTTTSSLPAPNTYTGSITTNGSGGGRTYTYNLITGYSYSYTSYSYAAISGYIFNGITGYTYASISGVVTNYTYTTNYVQYAEPGIVLTNGGQLPANGLSVVTPDPAYIVGNWNVTNTSGQGMLQTFNVSDSLPSAVYADAVTILSSAWNPNNSTASISGTTNRVAAPDTVNAAILTGNVPSNGSHYSGGVENFVRFQENWSGVNFYYNGSMVEMFPSQIANSPWPGTGTVYNPPNRNWSYDTNFNNPSQLPPLVPRVTYLNRVRWYSLTNGATVF